MTSDEITPSNKRLEALRDEVGPGPVVMLNVLKFKRARFEHRVATQPDPSHGRPNLMYRLRKAT